MRRSRFAKASGDNDARERASVDEALGFDLRSPASADEMSLASWRVASLEHAPVLLFATHVLIGATCVALDPQMATLSSPSTPAIPMLLVLALDIAAFLGLRLRRRLKIQPHSVVRGLCAYLALAGLLWTWFGGALSGICTALAAVLRRSPCSAA